MKIQIAVQCWGFIAVTGALAQGDNIPDLIADGPFALRVKGVASNSSIDGYLRTTDVFSYLEPHLILHYDRSTAPVADDSYYRFYFNYTGRVQTDGRVQTEGHEVGFFVSDTTVGEPNNLSLLGKAMSLQYRPNTTSTGAVVDLTDFDQDSRAFLDYYIDDSLTVVNKPANVSVDVFYYNWTLCWQTYYGITGQTLSWIMAGSAHNSTCEQVHFIKTEL
ncbi:hypothetical protein EV127DRAFT_514056 [Xylaria flabelliformis]|nr:hypothetical protein EV127DRAFT_514056 [Xylaria flabelliformis]